METRGDKFFAVMATKVGWHKPRFIWDGDGRQLYIYAKRKRRESPGEHNDEAKCNVCSVVRAGEGNAEDDFCVLDCVASLDRNYALTR